MRRALPLLLTVALASAAMAQDTPAKDRQRLDEARAGAAAATARAAALDRAVAGERDALARARDHERAIVARIARTEADLAAARARMARVAALLARQRAAIARGEAPAGRLLAALLTLARRPPLVAIAQPGSIDDLVRVRAVLGTVLPAVRERTVALRVDVARTRTLIAEAARAARDVRDGRTMLERERAALAALQTRHADRAAVLGRRALAASDRAIAMDEAARDISDRLADYDSRATVRARLGRLGAPPLPDRRGPAPAAYRLPVAGTLVTGLGEVSREGIRARGLTFAVAPGATVVAPAAGRVTFARGFRRYSIVVIIDHGDGWTSVILGLDATSLTRGQTVARGAPIGTASSGEAPRVTVELYRRDRPVDIAALVG